MGRRIATRRLFGRGSVLTDRLTRRGFLRRTAIVSASAMTSYLFASSVGAVIFPGGQTAMIANTGGDAVRLRSDASKSASVVTMLSEGAIILITNGPHDADGITWYQVQYSGQSGWVDADFIAARKLTSYAAVTFTDGGGVRLRDNTDTNANVVGMVPEGAIVLIVEGPKFSADGTPWYHVNHAGKHGYLMGTYLVPTDGPAPVTKPSDTTTKTTDVSVMKAPDVKDGDRVKVTNTDGAGVRMRDDAGYSADVLTILEEGMVVTVAGKSTTDTKGNSWVPVSFDGTKGFVVGPYLTKTDDAATKKTPLPTPPTASKTDQSTSAAPAPQSAPASATSLGGKIVAEAMKYVGYPYVWAGASPSGFDCSGFVMYIAQKAAGQSITHSIGQQASSGQYVAKENLQPGDLVFFANTYTAGLSHAGIYIGNGRFVHAENEGTGVVVSDINGGYYGPKYYTARRLG
jgi:cell wall-associated NlpC family hydrolase/SH3-like domain-containing protein